jgi:hypothetical protein
VAHLFLITTSPDNISLPQDETVFRTTLALFLCGIFALRQNSENLGLASFTVSLEPLNDFSKWAHTVCEVGWRHEDA